MSKKIELPQNKDGLHDDLLSRLSDDILVSILSCLPVKHAVVTSVLSRRWRHLWRQTVRLDFEDNERLNKIHLKLVAERNEYVKWVKRVIRQHKGPTIEEFKISFDLAKTAKGAIDKWIDFAISKNVQRLELNLKDAVFRRGRNYAFSDKIFARKCKPSSKRSSFNIPVRPNATVMEIKFLKALILNCVDVNDEGLKKILTNCSVLEHLSIHGSCELLKAKIHGKGLALKNLEIMCCKRLESVEICDSNIVSFNCRWSASSISYRLENLEKLEKIFIHDSERKMKPIFFQISCNIPYLKVLELRIYHPQEDMEFSTFPKLLNLKQLIVEVYEGELSMLTSMVEACPNLHRFKVKMIWMSPTFGLINKAAKQPHQHLEVVEINNYYGRNDDVELAMYFIENSVALKKLVIEPYKEKYAHAAKLAEENNAARYRAQQLLEPKTTPVGVELVIV